jgi:hypothetical protein
MKFSRILIATLVGGIVTFAWGAVSHMLTPLGHMGIKSLPVQQDQMIMNALNFSLKDRGFYMFPPFDEKACAALPKEEKTKAEEDFKKRYSAGPRGVVIFDPQPNVDAMGPKMLGAEAASNIVAAFFLTCIIALAQGGMMRGAIIGAAAGLFAALSIDVSYWNWYRFPMELAVAGTLEQSIGGLLTGMVCGLILGRTKPPVSSLSI